MLLLVPNLNSDNFFMPRLKTREGFDIHYEVCGNPHAKQTIIFGNGNGNCIKDFKELGYIKELESHFQLILMDALGYGDSDKPYDPAQYTPERRAADVIAVLDKLHIDRPYFFGGSIGGSLGFVLADLYPTRFLSFIIGSAHPYGSTKPCSNLFDAHCKEQLTKAGTAGFVAYIEDNFIHRKFPQNVRERFLKNDAKAIIAANTPIWPDRSSCLKNINVPVLLYAGAQDPVSEYLPEVAKQIKDCTVNILPNTDHCDAYWQGGKIATLIKNFIEKNFN